MTGHSLDVWVRHYVGSFGPTQRAEARTRLLEGGLGAVEAEPSAGTALAQSDPRRLASER